MREFDIDGLYMCRIQGRIFEKSVDLLDCSSLFFIKKYMYCEDCDLMDRLFFLDTSISDVQIIEDIKDSCTNVNYGQIKYDKELMYWLGYIYRYWAYVYELRSKQIYKICNGQQMAKRYLAYHSLDPLKVVERIYEDNNCVYEDINAITRKNIREIIKNNKAVNL